MIPSPKETLKEINKQPDRKERKETAEARKKEEEEFDLDEALNNPEFVEFLAKFPDAENLKMTDNDEKIQERYFRFKDQKELSKSLKTVFVGQIELESGMKMTQEDFSSVDEYISQLSIEKTDKFEAVLNSKKMFERRNKKSRKKKRKNRIIRKLRQNVRMRS
jgi:hypothetical protein